MDLGTYVTVKRRAGSRESKAEREKREGEGGRNREKRDLVGWKKAATMGIVQALIKLFYLFYFFLVFLSSCLLVLSFFVFDLEVFDSFHSFSTLQPSREWSDYYHTLRARATCSFK